MKDRPDHHDADLVLKVYELRREATMRESRNKINGEFWPKSFEEVVAVTAIGHPLNAPFRQVSTFWEMVYGIVKAGIVNGDYFLESNGEGIFLFAKLEPHLERLRAEYNPFVARHAEWVTQETETGRRYLELFRGRVAKALAARP
ncbi:MAG TPA: hypothetical protein VGR00_02040 [Thermoanaerobaculia bacterium]|nr:hypothetical protein [Thermoanaerobaculia bacterium]